MGPLYIFVDESHDSIDRVFDRHRSLCLDALMLLGIVARPSPLDELTACLLRLFPPFSVLPYLTLLRRDCKVNGLPADKLPCHNW